MIKKRVLSFLLTFVMLCSLLPVDVWAELKTGTGYTYDTESKTLTITGDSFDPYSFDGKENVAHVVIGAEVSGMGYTENGDRPLFANLFSGYSGLVSFSVDKDNPIYSAYDGALFNKEKTELYRYPPKKGASSFVFPKTQIIYVDQFAFKDVNYGTGSDAVRLYAREGTLLAPMDTYGDSTISALRSEVVTYTNVASLTLSPNGDLPLKVGDKKSLTAEVKPDAATFSGVSWSSSDETVATVNESGEVTAIAPGDATITATTVGVDESDRHMTAPCTVKVRSISVPSTLSLIQGGSATLTATVQPAGKAVTWSSDQPEIATVDATTGEVTAKSVGTATITATMTESGFEASCTVTVGKIPVEGVTLDQSTLAFTLFGGDSGSISK